MSLKSKQSQPETPYEPQGRDLFQTPNYAVDILIPFIPKYIKRIWEPSSGDGKITKRLIDNEYFVFSSDIRYSEKHGNVVYNFLSEDNPFPIKTWVNSGPFCIITNPPFSLKLKFYKKCREHGAPFALLIPADYSKWNIDAVKEGAEKVIPTRRIDYIPPFNEGSGANFHSLWLTWGFDLGRTKTFVELSIEDKKNI